MSPIKSNEELISLREIVARRFGPQATVQNVSVAILERLTGGDERRATPQLQRKAQQHADALCADAEIFAFITSKD